VSRPAGLALTPPALPSVSSGRAYRYQ
jgi:hypothetical protein